MNSSRWKLISDYTTKDEIIKDISRRTGIPPVAVILLMNRGMKKESEMLDFIRMSDEEFHDPFLIPDMDKAVDRIEKAIEAREKVVIYGDYDVDGVTSVSALYLYLKNRGILPGYYIPDRTEEGYGINNSAIERFALEKVSLMITVDTGVTAVEEVEHARSLGIDTVITDHHECRPELPGACAVVNPRRQDSMYPFKELAGVGVVFKLLMAMEFKRGGKEHGYEYMSKLCNEYIDIAAMGTIADVMPLVNENRLIVKKGLSIMNNRPRSGLTSLLNAAGKKDAGKRATVYSSTISFTVAPRINAAGRIDSARRAVGLFLSDDPDVTDRIAEELCEINRERQAEENRIIEEASEKIKNEVDLQNDRIIVLSDDGWHHGVIGIVASRITEKYGLPSILISFDKDIGKGSGRSVKGLNLVEALTDSSELLLKFGGHELAAGLSIERSALPAFKKRINEYVKNNLSEEGTVSCLEADCRLSPSDINVSTAEDASLLEPFGIANPSPLFVMEGCEIQKVQSLGEKHTKLILTKDGAELTALLFGTPRQALEMYRQDTTDVIFNLGINEFRGERTAQLILRGIRLSDGVCEPFEALRSRYREIMSGADFDKSEDILPSRDDLAAVYLYLKRRHGNTRDEIVGIREMLSYFKTNPRINYIKLRISLSVLAESGLIDAAFYGEHGENMKYLIKYVTAKANTEQAPTYVKLKYRSQK